ncbi:MAG: single-stranded DNA-binding protein [Paludibacteraceae bacterium]|nr:single-stranded DNA-binding protein [Paludibacteraceae bacterium]
MNKCLFIGNLVKDVEVQTSKAGKAFMNNTLAVTRKTGDGTDYLNITAFGKTAEVIGKYFSKGSRIGIEAHAQQSSYEKDGHKVYQITFIVDSIDFCERKGAAQTEGSDGEEELPFN